MARQDGSDETNCNSEALLVGKCCHPVVFVLCCVVLRRPGGGQDAWVGLGHYLEEKEVGSYSEELLLSGSPVGG